MRRTHLILAMLALSTSVQSQSVDYSGFWKANCGQPFGLQLKPAGGALYSVSFCGPGGCFEPGTYRPNTPLVGDPDYEMVSSTEMLVKLRDGGSQRYVKCTNDTKPPLRYK